MNDTSRLSDWIGPVKGLIQSPFPPTGRPASPLFVMSLQGHRARNHDRKRKRYKCKHCRVVGHTWARCPHRPAPPRAAGAAAPAARSPSAAGSDGARRPVRVTHTLATDPASAVRSGSPLADAKQLQEELKLASAKKKRRLLCDERGLQLRRCLGMNHTFQKVKRGRCFQCSYSYYQVPKTDNNSWTDVRKSRTHVGSSTTVMCDVCQVRLCFSRSKSCWKDFHSGKATAWETEAGAFIPNAGAALAAVQAATEAAASSVPRSLAAGSGTAAATSAAPTSVEAPQVVPDVSSGRGSRESKPARAGPET